MNRLRGSSVVGVACLVWVLGCGVARAADKAWTEAVSPHFVVVTDAGEKTARKVAWEFEQVRSALATYWPWAHLDFDRPMLVLGVSDEAGMKELVPRFWEQKGGIRPTSVTVTGADRHYVALRVDIEASDDAGQINPHLSAYWSYATTILATSFNADMPLWFSRGLAGVMSNTIVRDDHIDVGRVLPSHLARLQQGIRLTLRELIAVDRNSPYAKQEDRLEIFDGQSWIFMHYLMFGDEGAHRPQLDRYAGLVASGNAGPAAIEQAFGNLDALESGFKAYFNGRLFRYTRVKTDNSVDRARFSVRSLAPADTLSARAALHVAMNRATDAKALIEEAHKADPRAASAYDVEGLLAERGQQADQARAAYASAIELGSTHYFPYFRWAALSMRQGVDPETLARVEERLERATALNDRFAAAHALLADVRSQRGHHDEALTAARRAVVLDPRSASSRLSVARVLWNSGRHDEAVREARAAMPVATSEEERRMVQQTVDTLQQRLAAAQPQAARPASGAAPAPSAAPAAGPATAARLRSQQEISGLNVSCQSGNASACETLLAYFQPGCDQGFADACNAAGFLLFRGPTANQARAAGYFEKACSGGAKVACVMRASMQGQGIGVPRNEAAAATTLEQLCTEKINEACVEFSMLLLRRSTPQDTARARDLLDTTCKEGLTRACDLVAQLPPDRRR